MESQPSIKEWESVKYEVETEFNKNCQLVYLLTNNRHDDNDEDYDAL